jgi:hypothetical protein
MQPPDSDSPLTKKPATRPEPEDERLIELLGEVIRMSQAWVRALESGDPFTADKYEAQCLQVMEKFEAQRKKARVRATSFDQTV